MLECGKANQLARFPRITEIQVRREENREDTFIQKEIQSRKDLNIAEQVSAFVEREPTRIKCRKDRHGR
jgi:hypothetical protein